MAFNSKVHFEQGGNQLTVEDGGSIVIGGEALTVESLALPDLTASAAEINAVCDGNTATAAEITAVCDGATVTAAEINLLDGAEQADAIASIADTSTTDAEACGDKINLILAALRDFGVIAT